MSILSDGDVATIKMYRKAGVLQEVKSHLLDQTDGAVVVTCADGDRSYDIFMNHAEMQRTHREDPRIHWLTRNGGALRLAPDSPLNIPGRSTQIDFLEEIGEALSLKGIKVVALYAHAPCGKAGAHGLSLPQTLSVLMAAKSVVRESFPGIIVRCFYHVDFGPAYAKFGKSSQQLTYFLNKEMWEAHAGDIARQHTERLAPVQK